MSLKVVTAGAIAATGFTIWAAKKIDEWAAVESTRVEKLGCNVDGIKAVENILYMITDLSIIVDSTISNSRRLGDETISMIENGKQNWFGKDGHVLIVEDLQIHASTLLGKLNAGEVVTVYICNSPSLISLIPIMFKLVEQQLPCTFHVFSGIIDHSSNKYKLNYDAVILAAQSGFGFLNSQSVKECQDMALIAHVASIRTRIPFLHFLDAAYKDSVSDLLSNDALEKVLALIESPNKEENEEKEKEILYRIGYQNNAADIADKVDAVMAELQPLLGIRYHLFEYCGQPNPRMIIVAMGSVAHTLSELIQSDDEIGILKVRLFRPWAEEYFLDALPETQKIIVLDHRENEDDEEYGPLFKDVVATVQQLKTPPNVTGCWYDGNCLTPESLSSMFNPKGKISLPPSHQLTSERRQKSNQSKYLLRPESNYIKVLKKALRKRLLVSNAVNAGSIWGDRPLYHDISAEVQDEGDYGNVEFGFGRLLTVLRRRKQLISNVRKVIDDPELDLEEDLRSLLSDWYAKHDDTATCTKLSNSIVKSLENAYDAFSEDRLLEAIYENRDLFMKPSHWLVGGTNWAYDLSYSGIHHVVKSKENINLLVIETEMYSKSKRNTNWKKDIGLFAMNYGGVYVASVALYSNYTQLLQSITEADAFNGPSVVLAYAPMVDDITDTNPQDITLEMLKETKFAVDSGKWPLYRWNPSVSNQPFSLDSSYLKVQMKKFLERDNLLSLFARQVPCINDALSSSLDSEITTAHKKKRKKVEEDYAKLMKGLQNFDPLLIIYGSDGGNAEALAQRMNREAIARGLDSTCVVMDDCTVLDIQEEKNVLMFVSTAGQGEFPMNARGFWANVKSDAGPGFLTTTRYSVFSMGDYHYWDPEIEGNEEFFAKAGKDLDEKIAEIGGERLTECGIGDDAADDGFETGFAEWAPLVWEALGVGNVQGLGEGANKPPPDENIKADSGFLRGTIAEELNDESTGGMCFTNTKLTKFHGIYQQDDRDLRQSRREQGLEKAFSFMIRVGIPGGVCTPAQYIAMDDLANPDNYGTLKITTRQAWQLHGILKKNLKPSIAAINKALMTTLAACGDVCRNVMASPNPNCSVEIAEQITEVAREISLHVAPRTTAYHEIWLDKKVVAGYQDKEDFYGPSYLPRKFKVAIAVPPYNDTDCYAQGCCGLIAVIENEKLEGFNIVIGGGMGMTHGNKKTYPKTAIPFGFCTVDQVKYVVEKIMRVQGDFGDRVNRKHARLKYTLEDMTLEVYRDEVEKRLGYKLEESRNFMPFASNGDRLGWTTRSDGNESFTMFIEHGRIKDDEKNDFFLKTALREIAEIHKGHFALTANGNLIIGDVANLEAKEAIISIMQKYKVGDMDKTASGLRLSSQACAALPFCGLSFAESERYLPTLVTLLDKEIDSFGLHDERIVIRMTGCPNGCARPFVAEIGFVGKAPGIYNLYLGGGHAGNRLNKLYKDSVNETQIIELLRPILGRYAKEKNPGEHFGDFVIRAGIIRETTDGRNFHE